MGLLVIVQAWLTLLHNLMCGFCSFSHLLLFPLFFPNPHQGRSTYVVPTQQYPVQPGAPGFYPGASPTEFGTYGKRSKES